MSSSLISSKARITTTNSSITPWGVYHRRRINKEEKAKVVTAVQGNIIYSIPSNASCFVQRLYRRIGWIHPFLQIILVQNRYSAARNWINYVPPNSSDDLCRFFSINFSSNPVPQLIVRQVHKKTSRINNLAWFRPSTQLKHFHFFMWQWHKIFDLWLFVCEARLGPKTTGYVVFFDFSKLTH